MTTTTTPTMPTTHAAVSVEPTSRRRLLVPGLVSGAIAAVAVSATVVLARAGGEALAVGGEEIPLAGFAQFVLVGALIGVALARVLSRRATQPRSTFVRTTVILTVLSILPDLIVDAPVGTKLLLAFTHVLAAAILIPTLAARLPRRG